MRVAPDIEAGLAAQPRPRLQRRTCRRMTATIAGSGAGETLAHEIVRIARAVGLPTAAVFRGVDGFTPRSGTPGSPCHPPLVVVVTGDPESIDDLVVGVAPVLGPGELTVDDVQEIIPAGLPSAVLASKPPACVSSLAKRE